MAWWDVPFRMVQTNLREIDVTLDPKQLIDDVKEFGANVVLVNVGGIVAFYPTELRFHHRSDFMESDMIDAVIKEAHSQGVKVVGRFDFSKCHSEVYQEHPDWFWVGVDGSPVTYNGLYHTCVNGGYYREYCLKILEEALSAYPLDGVFFNMFGYQVYDYSGNYHGICQCPNCKDLFREKYGEELPREENWQDPVYQKYIEFKRITVLEVAQAISETIRRTRPETGIMLRTDDSDIIRLEVNRALDRELPEWGYWAGEQAKWSASFGKGRPYCSATVHFIDIPYRFVSESAGCMGLRMAQQLAGGSSLDFYVVGTLTQDDQKDYDIVKSLFKYAEKNQPVYDGLRSVARVALLDSRLTRDHYERRKPMRYAHHMRGAYRILVENHVPFDIIADERLKDDDALAMLSRYDAVILANVACLTDRQRQVLDDYVEAGGGLIATYETSLWDDKGNEGNQFRLRCLPAKSLEFKREDMRGAYLWLDEDIPGCEKTKRALIDEAYLFVRYEGEPCLRFDPPQPFGPPEKCYQLPGVGSERPGIIFGRYGQGKVAYFPWKVDRLYYRHSLEECAKLLHFALSKVRRMPPIVSTNAPPQVEMSIGANRAGDLIIHLVNFSGKQDTAYFMPLPIHNIEIEVKAEIAAQQAQLLWANSEMPCERTSQGIKLRVPKVELIEAIRIPGGAASL
jgi:hypothetical protein